MKKNKKQNKQIHLYPRKINLDFFHKGSMVNYDPTNKFYRVAFAFDFEKEVYGFIDSFIDLILTDEKMKEFGPLPIDKNMTDFYFDIITGFNSVSWETFSRWYYERHRRLANAARETVINTIVKQGALKIRDLEFFCVLSMQTLFSLITEEYFHKHFEKLNIMKENLMSLLGRGFEIILEEIYDDPEIDRLRTEKTREDKRKIEPLINRYISVYNDIGDMSNVEKIIFEKDTKLSVDRRVVSGVLEILESVIRRSRRVKLDDSIKKVMQDISVMRVILYGKKDRRMFAKLLNADRVLKERIIVKYEKCRIRGGICGVIRETGSGPLLNIIKQPETLEDMFREKKIRRYIIKSLKKTGGKTAPDLIKYINEAYDRFKRCKNRYFNALTGKELEKTLSGTVADISKYLYTVNYFYDVRKLYGKKSAYSEELSGLHIMRQGKIGAVKDEETEKLLPALVPVPDEQKTRLENIYEEGGLFYFRREGSIYPGEAENARGKKLFIFADLRNSTETTMKLTKDTASFLSPYLNTVYKVSKENAGAEIYFAGDGYAAHFSKVTDCLRTAYLIHEKFELLRRDAEIKIRKKEKHIYRELQKLDVIDGAGKIKKTKENHSEISDETADLLKVLSKDRTINTEDAVRRAAEESSMPKVEIGIGITEGELFIAVIGEESVKFNIVLSPSLTQAARLSGSNNKVKEYLEGLYGIKNIPRKVYAYEKNLFNQGIAVTTEVFNALRREAEVDFIGKEEIDLSYDVYFYYDKVLDKYMTMAKLENSVSLKGIGHDVDVFEVFTSVTMVDGYINDWIKKEMQGMDKQH